MSFWRKNIFIKVAAELYAKAKGDFRAGYAEPIKIL